MGQPLKDFVKMNVDVSFEADLLEGTTGAVIHESFANFVAAKNSKIEHVHDAMPAEVHTMKDVLILAQSIGCNRIILDSDCLEVISIIMEGGNSLGIAAADT
jgi:hypothetical protein